MPTHPLPFHADLIDSALQKLLQVKNDLQRHYQPTGDPWHADWPLVEASKSVNDAIALLCEHAQIRPVQCPAPGDARPDNAPSLALVRTPAPSGRATNDHPGCVLPFHSMACDQAARPSLPSMQLGSAWIGAYYQARR